MLCSLFSTKFILSSNTVNVFIFRRQVRLFYDIYSQTHQLKKVTNIKNVYNYIEIQNKSNITIILYQVVVIQSLKDSIFCLRQTNIQIKIFQTCRTCEMRNTTSSKGHEVPLIGRILHGYTSSLSISSKSLKIKQYFQYVYTRWST